jgi:hypothetical protein
MAPSGAIIERRRILPSSRVRLCSVASLCTVSFSAGSVALLCVLVVLAFVNFNLMTH